MKPSTIRLLLRGLAPAARIVALVYVGLILFMAGCQSRMIYYPRTASEPSLLAVAERIGMAPWRDAGGDIIGWRSSGEGDAASADARYLVFHGNAGFALYRDYFVDGLAALDGPARRAVYLFEYPGYGARGGRPSERTFQQAAEAAFVQLREEGDGRIFLVGESLGTGVAAHLAGEHPDAVAGLLLVTPFTRLADVGRAHYPYLPVRWLLREKYDNVRALEGYRGPVAILIAGEDEVIPARFGRELHALYPGPKRLWVQEGRRHNTLDYRPGLSWWGEAALLLEK